MDIFVRGLQASNPVPRNFQSLRILTSISPAVRNYSVPKNHKYFLLIIHLHYINYKFLAIIAF